MTEHIYYKPSALAIELYSSKAIAGKELSLSSWCIASLFIYHFSTVTDFSSEKYSGSTGHSHCKFLYWYQEFPCPVEPLYFSDEKSITVENIAYPTTMGYGDLSHTEVIISSSILLGGSSAKFTKN